MDREVLLSKLGAFSPHDQKAFTAKIDLLHEYTNNVRVRVLAVGESYELLNILMHSVFDQKLQPPRDTSYAVLANYRIIDTKGHCYLIDKNNLIELNQSKRYTSVEGRVLLVSPEKIEVNHARKILQVIDANPSPETSSILLGEIMGVPLAFASIKRRSSLRNLGGTWAMECLTDRGRVRRNNEDGVTCASFRVSTNSKSTNFRLLSVADGAGGHGHGEIASLEAINEVLLKISESILMNQSINEQLLHFVALSANNRVLEARVSHMSNMASTLTIALTINNLIFLAHVGDSRVYLIKKGMIKQLTEDHKYVEELVKRGIITKEQARFHPQRNIITSALGMSNPRIDVGRYEIPFDSKISILVCSDGLSDMLDDNDIYSIVLNNFVPRQTARELIREANKRGGRDNISVALDTRF